MARATGIGGVFFRSPDPAATVEWYRRHLGIDPATDFTGSVIHWTGGETTVWGIFPEDTDYFGERGDDSMVNFRVDDLDALLDQLRDAGVTVDDHIEEIEPGRFGWAIDCDGRRIELWEPAPGH